MNPEELIMPIRKSVEVIEEEYFKPNEIPNEIFNTPEKLPTDLSARSLPPLKLKGKV
jgi:hypothetical protein